MMEATLKDTGNTVAEIQVAEGSHVYIRTQDGTEIFKNWNEMTEEERESCKTAAEELESTIKNLAAALSIVMKSFERREAVGA